LRPWLTYPAWGVCLGLAVLAPLYPALAIRCQFYPFALGLVLLGLPHGAMDHLVWPHLRRRPLTLRYLGTFIAGYLALVLLYLVFWRAYPFAALMGFLGISWLHWGQGDYDYLRLFEGRPRPRNSAGTLLIWLVRGGLPIFLPILAFPATFARVGAGLTHWYGGMGPPAPDRGVVSFGVVALLVFVALYLRQAWCDDEPGLRRGFRHDVGELLLLGFLFARVPPLLAVGTYFCVWHSARHIGRLMLADPITSSLLSEGRAQEGVWRTILQSLPMMAGAVVLLGGLYIMQRHRAMDSLAALVYLYLSLIAALTVPHFLVVLWMDRRQRL
jgi:Brp/Blh family beta-carotene 15,15'-monooxygenase